MYSLNWPRAYGIPQATAQFKLIPDDFHVDEYFNYSFTGEGEHLIIKVEKRGVTTEDVVKALARALNKPIKIISYAGLKDKQALSTQWLSIHVPGEKIEGINDLHGPGWRVLESTRHNKKLRPGCLAGNRFTIFLREVQHAENLIQRLECIKNNGVPNYFGEQRFGREGGNLIRAEEVLVQGRRVKDRFLRGIYFSTARSWLFNLILSKRVEKQTWNAPLQGDVMQLQGTNSIFVADAIDEEIMRRVEEKDIAPASPLPGKTKNKVTGEALALIEEVYAQWQAWVTGLENNDLEEAWRSNILYVEELSYQLDDNNLTLSFKLPAGTYATAVLREMVIY